LIDWIEIEGPVLPVWPPISHQTLLFDSPNKEKGRKILRPRSRLPIHGPCLPPPRHFPAEIDSKLALYDAARTDKQSFLEAIKLPFAAILSSPSFLFLVEPEAPSDKPRRLNSYELASRLSYFLWSSAPDTELTEVAAKGDLLKPEVIKAQVKRMLANPKSTAFVKNFTGQWLGLRRVGSNPPTKTLYPEYDRHLETSIVQETEGFFSEILRKDLDARCFIESNFLTINERLARFYRIPDVEGDEIRTVPAPSDSHRGGLITQASIHSITSNGTRTSPVTRGVWVLKTLLGTDPGLPVANVAKFNPKSRESIKPRSVNASRSIAKRRLRPCHDKIDPLGLAMENFNAAGEWRDQEGHGYNGRIEKNDPKIDASAKMPDGTEFNGVEGLQEQSAQKEDLFTSPASQLTTYALGRELGFPDRPMIRTFVEKMKTEHYSLVFPAQLNCDLRFVHVPNNPMNPLFHTPLLEGPFSAVWVFPSRCPFWKRCYRVRCTPRPLPTSRFLNPEPSPRPAQFFATLGTEVNIAEWVPTTNGKDYALSPTLETLKEHQADFSVLSGLGHSAQRRRTFRRRYLVRREQISGRSRAKITAIRSPSISSSLKKSDEDSFPLTRN